MQPMLNIALRAARSAAELIVRSMDRLDALSVNEKDSKDYVTQVDRAAEKAIVNTILKAYPDHGIFGEEGSSVAGHGEGADYQWVIDPLDGTTNYIHGIPHFAVSMAVMTIGELIVAPTSTSLASSWAIKTEACCLCAFASAPAYRCGYL